MDLTLIVRETEDGIQVFTGMAVGIPPESAVWLTISGARQEYPPKRDFTKREFVDWALHLKAAGYTFHAEDCKGNAIEFNLGEVTESESEH